MVSIKTIFKKKLIIKVVQYYMYACSKIYSIDFQMMQMKSKVHCIFMLHLFVSKLLNLYLETVEFTSIFDSFQNTITFYMTFLLHSGSFRM